MCRIQIVFFFLCLPLLLSAQEKGAIQGRVTDAATGEPMPYAQAASERTTLGTVTNEDGIFRLKLPDAGCPDANYPDSLMVSFLGFQTEKLQVSSVDTGTLEIFLIPVSLNLREVEIIALSSQEVLRRALDSISVNYGVDPVILTAFIRTQKMVNKNWPNIRKPLWRT